MSSRFIMPYQYAYDAQGLPLQGAKLYFYQSGTNIPLTVYTDSALTTPNTNPVISDSTGNFGNIFLAADDYKIVLKTALGVEVFTADPVIVTDNFTTGAGIVDIGGALTTAILTNVQTGTTYTVLTTDRAKLVVHSNINPITVTLPNTSASFPNGWYYYVKNNNTGIVTINCSISTIDGASSITLQQNEGAIIVSDGANYRTCRDALVINSLVAKPVLVNADEFVLADSADSYKNKKILKSDLVANIVPITTRGDIVRGSSANIPERLALGLTGQALMSNGTDIAYNYPLNNIIKTANQTYTNTGSVDDTLLKFTFIPNTKYACRLHWGSGGPNLNFGGTFGLRSTVAITSIFGVALVCAANNAGAASNIFSASFNNLSDNLISNNAAGQATLFMTFTFVSGASGGDIILRVAANSTTPAGLGSHLQYQIVA